MGILDKIEDKLSGSHKKEQTGYENSATSGDYSSTGSGRQNPIGSSAPHGTAVTGSNTHGTSGLTSGHGTTQSNVPGSYTGEGPGGFAGTHPNTSSGLTDRTRGDYTTDATGGITGGRASGLAGSHTDHNTARDPVNPYSSSGQRTAANAIDPRDNTSSYGASNNRAAAGDVGSRRDYDDPSVLQRGTHGSVSNDLKTGPHSSLENRDAVPVAGGQPIGTGAAYQSQSQGYSPQYEQGSTHGDATGPHKSSLMNKLDPRVDSKANQGYDSNTGYGSTANHSTTGTSGLTSTHGRSGAHDPNDGLHRNTQGNVSSHETYDRSYPGTTTTSTTSTTTPHNSSMMNKLDPRVDPNAANTSNQYGSTTSSSNTYGRDAALTSGAAGVGSNAYSQKTRDQPLSSDTRFNDRHGYDNNTTSGLSNTTNNTPGYNTQSTTSSSNTTQPHNSSLMNKLDPRVDSNAANTTSGSYNNTSSSNTTSSGSGGKLSSILNSRHATYDRDRSSHGGGHYGTGYEQGYDAAYKHALEHVESERRAGRY